MQGLPLYSTLWLQPIVFIFIKVNFNFTDNCFSFLPPNRLLFYTQPFGDSYFSFISTSHILEIIIIVIYAVNIFPSLAN